jgi:hypothetical protein
MLLIHLPIILPDQLQSRQSRLPTSQAMWPQNPICTLVILLSIFPRAISLRYPEYSWVEGFDRSDSHGYDAEALGGGAMPVPMSGTTKGWWARWLAVGGEGDVTVHVSTRLLTVCCVPDDQLSAANLTLPHRPAAFPAHTSAPFVLPLSGQLVSFTSLPPPASKLWPGPSGGGPASDTQACIPASELRWTPPKAPFKIALVERGGCDFATKVRAAQERGAAGVVVGDMISHPGESEEEGRERESLITMFSPGTRSASDRE